MFPLSLHWYAEPAPGGGYDYAFALIVEGSFDGEVDGLVFVDTGNGAPADADALLAPALRGIAPAPFTAMEWANGSHEGPIFENHPSAGWAPAGVGDRLEWTVHADNLVESLYWSTTRGDGPWASYEPAVRDCALSVFVPTADLHVGACAGAVKVCDPVTLDWIEPDYTAMPGYQAIETLCDQEDNDCDGTNDNVIDEPLADVQVGACAGARKVCVAGAWTEPDYATQPFYEASEVTCDTRDNDCDGLIDLEDPESGLAPVLTEYQYGVCAGSTMVCTAEGPLAEPDWWDIVGFEDEETLCDALDNDCDGRTDEAVECAEITTGCGCATGAPAAGSAAWAALIAWGAARRRVRAGASTRRTRGHAA